MGRMMLFAGDNYYPVGGAYDFVCRVDSIEYAEELIAGSRDEKLRTADGWALVCSDNFEVLAEWVIRHPYEKERTFSRIGLGRGP